MHPKPIRRHIPTSVKLLYFSQLPQHGLPKVCNLTPFPAWPYCDVLKLCHRTRSQAHKEVALPHPCDTNHPCNTTAVSWLFHVLELGSHVWLSTERSLSGPTHNKSTKLMTRVSECQQLNTVHTSSSPRSKKEGRYHQARLHAWQLALAPFKEDRKNAIISGQQLGLYPSSLAGIGLECYPSPSGQCFME